jgi:hypothetical protein
MSLWGVHAQSTASGFHTQTLQKCGRGPHFVLALTLGLTCRGHHLDAAEMALDLGWWAPLWQQPRLGSFLASCCNWLVVVGVSGGRCIVSELGFPQDSDFHIYVWTKTLSCTRCRPGSSGRWMCNGLRSALRRKATRVAEAWTGAGFVWVNPVASVCAHLLVCVLRFEPIVPLCNPLYLL